VIDLDELLDLACSIVTRVMKPLADARADASTDLRDLVRGTKSTGTDMVTDMDLWAERVITEALAHSRPHDAIVGEEGTRRDGTTGVQWYVDPIDGTTNYLYGHPGYSVSIGASVDGAPAIGVVGDPTLNELFRARRGGGAFRNDLPIAASSLSSVADALVGTGFGYRSDRRRAQAKVLERVLPEVRDIRRMGGAAIDLCSVACGRLDAYYEFGIAPWDVAAGSVVALEAGAIVTDLAGRPTLGPMIVAAGPGLHDDLCRLLRAAGADQMPT
jgi:fructose-1,6-bisphosphatase/inositol monophosphatase family enzyme